MGELLRSYHDCVAGFAPGTGFDEGPQAVAASQVVCHGDIAPRNTVFAHGRATAFIDWDGIFVSTPMWDLAHAVWQFAPVCDDADRWLGGWPIPPDRSARIAALVGGYRLGAERADELADMVVEVIAGWRHTQISWIEVQGYRYVRGGEETVDLIGRVGCRTCSQRRCVTRGQPVCMAQCGGRAGDPYRGPGLRPCASGKRSTASSAPRNWPGLTR